MSGVVWDFSILRIVSEIDKWTSREMSQVVGHEVGSQVGVIWCVR
jgi:hypothetical protein